MRDIEFRAWDRMKEKMVRVKDLWWKYDAKMPHVNKRLNHIIMQYTGITDKKGKDIFEGDILEEVIPKCLLEIMRKGAPKTRRHTMCFKDNKFIAISHHPYPYNENKFWHHISSDCEIIGNIHENPELLKTQDGAK